MPFFFFFSSSSLTGIVLFFTTEIFKCIIFKFWNEIWHRKERVHLEKRKSLKSLLCHPLTKLISSNEGRKVYIFFFFSLLCLWCWSLHQCSFSSIFPEPRHDVPKKHSRHKHLSQRVPFTWKVTLLPLDLSVL